MSAASEFAQLARVLPAEAIAYMAKRGLSTETGYYSDLWQSQHERAFTISRLTRADLLERVQGSLSKSVAGDLSRRDWLRETRTLLQKEGLWGTVEVKDPITGEPLKTTFNEARLRLIHDTNVRQALAAGQWQRMLRNQARYPYARYVAMDDERTRPDHRAWHNTVLPVDHPWWSTHRPPNGYHCRCRVIGLTQAEFERGFSQSRPGAETDENAPLVRETFKTEPPPEQLVDWRNPRTGEVQKIPKGIDPGFNYNPGSGGAAKATDELVQKKLAALSPAVRAAALAGRLRIGLANEQFLGERDGLFSLPPVKAVLLDAAAFGAVMSTAELGVAATRSLRQIAQTQMLLNEDSNRILSGTGSRVGEPESTRNLPPPGVLQALKDLVFRAVVAERFTDSQDGDGLVNAVLRLYALVRIGALLHRVRITVKELLQGVSSSGKVLTLESVEIETDPLAPPTASPASGAQSAPATPARSVTVADLLRSAKRQDGQPFDSKD